MFPFYLFLKEQPFDERFVLHRYKSTSHAGVVVALAMAGWTVHDRVVLGQIRWDFLALLGLMALVKLGFMAWYSLRD